VAYTPAERKEMYAEVSEKLADAAVRSGLCGRGTGTRRQCATA